MPELPDLAIVADAFHAALAGRSIASIEAPGPLAIRGTPAEVADLVGQRLIELRRRGKFLIALLDRDRIVFSPMLTGRFQLARPAAPLPTKTAVVIAFGERSSAPRDAARWTRGADWIPGDETAAEIRYRDPTQMGKIYILPAGVSRPVAGFDDDQGPDADDRSLTPDVWRQRIRRHPGELKNLLKNQAFIAGIGNAYSDEILRSASGRASPRRRSTRCIPRRGARSRTPSTSYGGASHRRSRSRPATGSRCTTRAGSRARAAAPGSARSSPAAS